jgi:hypothetical protein
MRAMKSVRIRSDFTVKLPEELRAQVRPGDTLGVIVTGGKVTYVRAGAEAGPSLREIIERIRSNPSVEPLSDAQVESIVHRVRRRR